ncbi:unnamed protein product [Cyprideis torosa]|uniref:Uncharacterized protein n=1 Tax=Cyprideis torosa TaxID=163714 RepID=A0A7R8W582_9CRUS|nr:unnamed protein product [Cyprideis torosa]CAG0884966.1 unnamed protein product [Cyprideis torosa]
MARFAQLLVVSQLSGYVVAFILSFLTFIPLILHQKEFRGRCVLFTTGTWSEEDGQLVASWASPLFCDYCIVIGIFLIPFCALGIYRSSKYLYYQRDCIFLFAFLDAITCGVFAVLYLIAALFITIGFQKWCRTITKRFESCQDATVNAIDVKDNIDTSWFYVEVGAAQFGAWATWSVLVGLTVFATLKVWQSHQQENIRLTMAQNRRKLCKGAVEDAFFDFT